VDTGYFGCSVTYGIGVQAQELWCHQVDLHQQTTSNNYALQAIGIQEIAGLFLGASQHHHMQRACFLLPDLARASVPITVQGQVEYWHIFPSLVQEQRPRAVTQAVQAWLALPDEYYWSQAREAILAVQARAESAGIHTVWSTWSESTQRLLETLRINLVEPCWNDLAGADGSHPGAEAHFAYAMRFRKGF
jgi:hypothetical protein